MTHEQDREQLRSLLLRDGILFSSDSQPIVSRDGTTARWMLDSLGVSLTTRGAELAGRCFLAELAKFESRQIATYGTIGIPLLQACVMLSGGKYRGILVRKQRKQHGSRKLIEGSFDRDQPVVILDDSVSSGLSMSQCANELEQAGFCVEGGVCLVRFGWYGGFARMRERGLHMEYVFDVYRDLVAEIDGEHRLLPRNPSKLFPAFVWADEQAAEGLHPAALARQVMEHHLRGEPILRPPAALDRDYDSAGGAWVSVRSRVQIHLRHARDGFWHFPGESRYPTPEGLTRAAVRTAHKLAGPEGLGKLAASGVAVTFFGALEECGVGKLDNDRYGIVVVSRERVGKMGGALPRMPGMSREWAQFEHARRKNAQLVSFEPYALFRHEVHKLVEPGITWQPTGVPAPAESDADWQYDPRRAGRIAERVFDLVWSRVSGESPRRPPLPDNLLPELEGVFVTLYLHGQVVGCMGGKCRRPEEDLAHAVEMALADGRFAQRLSRERLDEAVVTVSFLYDPQQMGRQSPEEIAIRYRHGEQVLMVKQGTRSGILLPFVVVQRSLTPAQYVAEVIDKAGITRPPYQWVRFDCKTWLADAQGARPLLHGLPSEPLAGAEVTPTSLPASLSPNLPGDLSTSLAEAVTPMAGRLAGYLLGHRNALGLPSGYYRPFLDIEADEIELARRIHGVWVMARAGRVLADGRLTAAARQAVGHLLPRLSVDERGDTWVGDATSKALASEVTIAEVVFLMLSLCELARTAGKAASEGAEGGAAGGRGGAQTVALLAETLWRRIDRHGRISTHAAPPAAPSEEQAARLDALQDYLPAQALLGLASAAGEPLNTRFERPAFGRALGRYLHRFRYKRNWGQVCWLPQAAAGWWHASRDPAAAAIAYEVVDWALEHQQEKSGGFINEMQPDSPGYTTGVFLEGVAAALGLAAAAGEAEQARAERYRCACLAGLGFLDGLVYRERDRAFLPNPERAYGGLRISRTASDVRIDFVSHALNALVEMRLAEADSHC